MTYRPLVGTNARDDKTFPVDFFAAHRDGIPHRAVHIVICNSAQQFFTCRRLQRASELQGRVELPGGHCDYLIELDRPETYEEAALREVCEELNLCSTWSLSEEQVVQRLQSHLTPLEKVINRLPSCHGNNMEHVVRFQLAWQDEWPAPSAFQLSNEGNHDPQWRTLEQLKQYAAAHPDSVNAAVRLFLRP